MPDDQHQPDPKSPADSDAPATTSDGVWRPRRLHELTDEERAEYDRELESGVTELPPNEVQGLLGERSPSLYKVDQVEPGMNAGLSQEDDAPVKALLFLLVYLVFFPLAFVLLWRSRRYSRRYKIIVSVVMALGVLIVAAVLVLR